MAQGDLQSMGDTAHKLSRNPLGIIALFIVLVYAMATLIVALGSNFTDGQRWVLTCFIAGYPILVLGIFAWLVCNHSAKLFGPSDYKDDRSFLDSLALSTSYLAAAAEDSLGGSEKSTEPDEQDKKIREAAQSVQALARDENLAILRKSSILWVDDRGTRGNRWLRAAFRETGVEVDLALTTDEAIALLHKKEYGAIISDMRRPEGDDAGHTLLRRIRSDLHLKTPFFVHSSQNDKVTRDLTIELGGDGHTGDATTLFNVTMQALGIKQSIPYTTIRYSQ